MITIVFVSPTSTVKVVDGQAVCRSIHATARSAEVYAATEELRGADWTVRGPASGEGYRLPLLLHGEQLFARLDGAKCDRRAKGFTATRGDAILRVDASAGLPLLILANEGDTEHAIEIVLSFLGREITPEDLLAAAGGCVGASDIEAIEDPAVRAGVRSLVRAVGGEGLLVRGVVGDWYSALHRLDGESPDEQAAATEAFAHVNRLGSV